LIRGIYTAATGMGIQQLKQETITNNLANVSTAGYKKDTTVFQSFSDMLMTQIGQKLDKKDVQFIGKTNFGALVGDIVTDFRDGFLEDTGDPLNFALAGDGFFTVETPEGNRYTRDGNFSLDREGFLVTQNGHRVQSNQGHVFIGEGDFVVKENGQISVDEQDRGVLSVTSFENPDTLKKIGQNLYAPNDQTEQGAAVNTKVFQNHLEKSNINMVDEMIELMSVVRTFEANQKLIQAQDEMLQKSVNEVGSVR